jgi:L-lactate dehydrogenase complex protein LldE
MEEPRRVALFVTCLVDQLMPEIGVATVRLLRRAGCDVVFPAEQICCGQPFFNSGFKRQAESLAMRTVEIFEDQESVVLPSGSCTAMIRAEYPHLLSPYKGWQERAERLAAKSYELSEFLVHEAQWKPEPGVNQKPKEDTVADPAPAASGKDSESSTDSPPAHHKTVTYHDSCHMCRYLNLRQEPRQLLNRVGYSLHEMGESDRCCGFGGLFSLRMHEVSTAMTTEKIDQVLETETGMVVTADPGCLMQLRSLMQMRSLMQIRQLPGDKGPEMEHLAVLLERMTR